MKLRAIFLPAALAVILTSCDAGQEAGGGQAGASAEPPAAPTAEVLAALEAQPIGGKLVGNTVRLVGDQFEPADLAKAPDYYLVYYSASW